MTSLPRWVSGLHQPHWSAVGRARSVEPDPAERVAPVTELDVLTAPERAMWERLGQLLPGWPLPFPL
jgi:hypothetical protein